MKPFDLSQFDPQVLTENVVTLGEDWADKDGAASALEESKKVILAKLSLEHAESGRSPDKPRGISAAAAEAMALKDSRYEAHIEMMVQARKEANKAKVRYDMGKMQLELIRSLVATLRDEMRMNSFKPN